MWRGFCGWSANNGPLFGGSRSVRVKLASENPPTPVGVPWDVFASRSPLLRSMTSTTTPFSNVVSKPNRVLFVNLLLMSLSLSSTRQVRQGHNAQLDEAAEGRPCPSPLCRGKMASSHRWQLPHGARGQLGKSGRSHTLLCQSRQRRLVECRHMGLKRRTGKWTGRMGNQFVFPCSFQVTRVKWFLTEHHLHGTVCWSKFWIRNVKFSDKGVFPSV